jgi:hypothetical protein
MRCTTSWRPPRHKLLQVADLLVILAVLVAFGAVMIGLALLTRRARGRRIGSSVAGPFEEIWHPAAHRARIDIEVQDERKIGTPSPGDPLEPDDD